MITAEQECRRCKSHSPFPLDDANASGLVFCYATSQPVVLFLNCWLWEVIFGEKDLWKIKFNFEEKVGGTGENDERHRVTTA